jgi:uncharacterized membrane protein YeaQ/YmgE (transglycosylase-associated protein family)
MWILWTFVVGLIVGAIAKLIMPGRDGGGIFMTSLLGVAGSFIAALVGRKMGWYAPGQGAGFIASIGGALLLLLVYRMIFRRR